MFKTINSKHLVCTWLFFAVTAFHSSSYAQSRLPVTISNTSLPATTLSDYTVRLDLNSTNAPGFDFTNNGDDVVAFNADTTAQLDFYVESVDPVGQTAVVWVRVPSVPPSPPNTEIFLDYNRTDLAGPLSNLSDTFVNEGITYHSQPHTGAAPGPESRAAGEAEFNFNEVTSNPNYGCTDLAQLNDDHSDIFTQNGDYGLAITTQIVVPADALYEFRLGADFGNGGQLYIDGNALEEDWTDDLWWANNFSNPDVLQGSTFLTAGFHTLRALGYERCCDGPAQLQYRYDSDGDGSLADESFSILSTTSPGITILAPSCPVADATIGPVTTVPVTLAKFSSSKAGPFIRLNWETADETFNAGFKVWTLLDELGEQTLHQLSPGLIRSRTFDSSSTQRYQWNYRVKKREVLETLVLSSVGINGEQEFFGPFDVNQTYGDSVVPQVIDWQAVHENFKQSMAKKGYTQVRNRWRKHAPQAMLDGGALHLEIAETGVYRLTYDWLKQQGVDWLDVPVKSIAVTKDGQPIPRSVVGVKRQSFGPGGSIDFVGVAPDDQAAIYASTSRYQIQLNPQLSKPTRKLSRQPENPKSWRYQSQRLANNNRHVIFSPFESPWMMDLMFRSSSPASVLYDFLVPELVATEPAHLNIELGGISNTLRQDFDQDGQLDNHHVVSILVNGLEVEQLRFDGQREIPVQVQLTKGLVKQGVNTVEVRAEVNGYDFDIIAVKAVTLSYPVSVELSGTATSTEVTSEYDGVKFEHKGARKLIGYAYLEDHNLIRLKPVRARGSRTFPMVSNGLAHYFIGHPEDLLIPESASLISAMQDIVVNDVDMLVVAHPAFIGESLKEYVQARSLQGVQSQIIGTDAIWSQSPDVPLHVAIQRFLKRASDQTDYKYVLIVGGHTFDYVGRQNSEALNFIPTYYTSIGSSRFTPTDQPFVDFDGDGFPEKSIGRWPVRSVQHVRTIVSKSLSWIAAGNQRENIGHDVLLLADRTQEFDFAADLNEYVEHLGDLQVNSSQKIYVDEHAPNVSGGTNKTIKQKVFDAFSSGVSWVVYNGHGSPNAWSFSQLMSASEVVDLDNYGAPVLITSLGCYTTYYESPDNNSLALQLMFSGENAAVAVHGPSVVGGYEGQFRLSKAIADEMTIKNDIGGAIMAGMLRMPINKRSAVSNWALLGDPSLPLR